MKRGWWSFKIDGLTIEDLSEVQLERIGGLISEGYTEGELLVDEEGSD